MMVSLNDKVTLKKQPFMATSHRGEIYLENYNKKLKYFVLNDDVKLEEKVVLGGHPTLGRPMPRNLKELRQRIKLSSQDFLRFISKVM